ncbi:dihydrodipicolinate synthase family protein [Fodinibius salsisoli]|uniref:Dihydrodipicolinate synthase family protein n=1 Tax=Fodinibius salsisoli TaxID=2820877 RepID=A0ABT3PH95_9BACT|nr:dihydrodipicolinate synthase family protein [Fodinibius salsisoli]MCW9705286.1 dihydrodipicolinate synthase family protein [Fodinibius salsisoli]
MKVNKFEGIIPPMVTPLQKNGKLDVRGLEKLLNHLIEGGVNGLFILGTTGEGPSLSYHLREELIKRVCRQVDGRVPVLVGISDSSYDQSVYIAEKSREYGAEAVVAAPPFYLQITQEELYRHMQQLVNEVSLPVFLYNYPGLTKTHFGLDTLAKLLELPGVIGVKDSSGDMDYFNRVRQLVNNKGLPLLIGPEELLMKSLVMGGQGGVSGGANIFPELYVGLYKNIQEGNLDEASKLHERIMKLSSVVYSGSDNSSGNVISGIKKALSCLNVCEEYVEKPLMKVSDEKAGKIKQFLSEYA